MVRRIFDDYVAGGHSIREILRRLNADGVSSPSGTSVWHSSTVGRLLRNEAYVGRVFYNRTEAAPATAKTSRRSAVRRRPREEWVAIAVPAILAEEVLEAAQSVSRDNSRWSARRIHDQAWLCRGLTHRLRRLRRGREHRSRANNGGFHYYYDCRNHDSIRAGGDERRCPERRIRADALDAFVFDPGTCSAPAARGPPLR